MVVFAHPDDVDFGAAGTVAAWTSAGVEVAYCVGTSGEAGSHPGAVREAEQRAAAAEVGVSDVVFLGYPDGRLTASLDLRRDIARQIRRFRPDRVLAWSPEINWDHVVTAHPDHRAMGEAAFAAVYPDARNAHAHPELLAEGLRPWTVPELWLADAPARLRNHAVDITAHFDRKLAALRSHVTQTGGNSGLEAQLRAHFSAVAARHGITGLAEEFQVVDTS
ncbi:GlcNAc-PI de-N-acetylase [Actinokineospora fastidiosa]|uniref:GlcNAc-PI de-N-acetylase n=1 Tax=Actinokineospora fastidiosa TaxID=1816 RepID=A0A918GAM2_9PSEU|nr:GlcNAc-PI de-N-acetylase [Actinokineospora fastidiosa]